MAGGVLRICAYVDDVELHINSVVLLIINSVFSAFVLILLFPHPILCMTKQVSNQIYAAILPHIGKLNVLLDSSEDILALYHLFTAMDPSTISVQVKYTYVLHLG